jgi:hypothetical protein
MVKNEQADRMRAKAMRDRERAEQKMAKLRLRYEAVDRLRERPMGSVFESRSQAREIGNSMQTPVYQSVSNIGNLFLPQYEPGSSMHNYWTNKRVQEKKERDYKIAQHRIDSGSRKLASSIVGMITGSESYRNETWNR